VTRVLSALAIGAIVQLVHSSIVLFFSIWLLGVAFSRVKIEASKVLRAALTLLLVGSAVFIRLKGLNDITPASYPQYLLFSLILVVFLSSKQFRRSSTAGPHRSLLRQFFIHAVRAARPDDRGDGPPALVAAWCRTAFSS
jgi:hypothetical protein